MNIVKVLNKAISFVKGDSRDKKLEVILDHLIESIDIRGDIAHVKINKDLILENNCSFISVSKGYNIVLADKIHLNPNIKLDTKDDKQIENIKQTLDDIDKQKVTDMIEDISKKARNKL